MGFCKNPVLPQFSRVNAITGELCLFVNLPYISFSKGDWASHRRIVGTELQVSQALSGEDVLRTCLDCL